MTLQLAAHTVAPGLFSRKASAAGASYSIAHLVTAAPSWCRPSLRPPQPAKMSMHASARPSAAGLPRGRAPLARAVWPAAGRSGASWPRSAQLGVLLLP